MGKKNVIIFKEDKIPSILDIYSFRVKHNEYKRIPYEIWKQLKHASKWKVEYSYEIPKWFEIIVDNRWSYFYNNEEIAGFCDFLLDYLKEKEQAESIMPTDYGKVNLNYENFCATLDDASIYTSSAISGEYLANNYNGTLATTPPSNATKVTTIDGSYYTKADTITIGTYGGIKDSVTELSDRVAALETKINNKKEGKENMKGFKFDFGTCEKDNVRISMYGLAIQNAEGIWVSYDATNKSIIDVDLLNIDCRKYMFKMPVAIKDIKIGDVIIHNRKPMFVTSVKDGLKVVDVHAGEAKEIMLTKSMFGFDFATKVVSMFDFGAVNASADSPFGNMLPLLLMSEGEKNINPMMLYMMMQQGNSANIDPMMMMLMMGDDNKDMLPLMFMMNQNRPIATPAATPSTVTE